MEQTQSDKLQSARGRQDSKYCTYKFSIVNINLNYNRNTKDKRQNRTLCIQNCEFEMRDRLVSKCRA